MSLFEISGASNISKDDYESSAQEGERSNSIIQILELNRAQVVQVQIKKESDHTLLMHAPYPLGIHEHQKLDGLPPNSSTVGNPGTVVEILRLGIHSQYPHLAQQSSLLNTKYLDGGNRNSVQREVFFLYQGRRLLEHHRSLYQSKMPDGLYTGLTVSDII